MLCLLLGYRRSSAASNSTFAGWRFSFVCLLLLQYTVPRCAFIMGAVSKPAEFVR